MSPKHVTPVLLLLFSLCAQAQVPGQIDDDNGCHVAPAPQQAKRHCSDFEVSRNFPQDPFVERAHKQCLAFYELALRLQNTFCSYQADAVRVEAAQAPMLERQEAGQANVSEREVARNNRRVAEINKAYMAKLADLGAKFRKAYEVYIARLGKVNSQGGYSVMREASCLSHPLGATMELNTYSPVPGHLRELLVAASHGNAHLTWDHMWPVVRENYAKLKQVKEEAEQNATIAEMREIEVGKVFETSVQAGGTGTDPRLPMTPVQGAMSSAAQEYIKKGIQSWMPKIPAPAASVIGGGVIVAYNYYTNKKIMYPETLATFVGMLNPGWGMFLTVTVAAWRTQDALSAEYRDFARDQLKNNVHLTTAELVEAWGKHKKADQCLKSAAMEASCAQRRAANPRDPGGNCKMPIEMQRALMLDDGGAR